MAGSIRVSGVVEHYYTRNADVYRGSREYKPRIKDSVHISQEAIDRFNKLGKSRESGLPRRECALFDPESRKSLSTLGLGPNATPDQIRRAFLKAVSTYHPDKFASLPSEFQKLAEEKTKEINSAYSNLKKHCADSTSTQPNRN